MSENYNDYKKGYNLAKVIVVAVCVLCSALSICIIKTGLDEAEEERQSIFVADVNNTLLVALSNDMELNRPNEAKATLKRLHFYLFNLTPTADNINGNIASAESLSDESILQYVEKTKECGWYNKMIAEGISTEFKCDSIQILGSDREEFEFSAKLFGKQSQIYSDRIEFKEIQTSCYLTTTDRTIENPNGFRIQLWKVDKEEIIKVVRRKRAVHNVEINKDTIQ